MIPSTRHSGKSKTMATVKRSVVAKNWGIEECWIVGAQGFSGQWKYSVNTIIHAHHTLYISPNPSNAHQE